MFFLFMCVVSLDFSLSSYTSRVGKEDIAKIGLLLGRNLLLSNMDFSVVCKNYDGFVNEAYKVHFLMNSII